MSMNSRYLIWLLFSFKGVLDRIVYIKSILSLFLIGFLTTSFFLFSDWSTSVPLLVIPLLNILFAWMALSLGVKRLRDTGNSLWFLLLCLIPYVGFLFTIYLININIFDSIN